MLSCALPKGTFVLDLRFVVENRERVLEILRLRGLNVDQVLAVADPWALDAERRSLLQRVEQLRHRQRLAGEEIARRGKAREDASGLKAEMKGVAEEIKGLEALLQDVQARLDQVLLLLPNVPDASVPVGADASGNQEVRRVGKPPRFDFTPRAHWDLGPALGILDFDRAAKISGARFAVYWGLGAKLERALANFMLDLHTREHGYTEVLPPYMVNSASMYGTGQLPKFAADLFKCENADLWLVPTAEVPLTNLYRDETIEASRLPLSVTAYTPCFRSEAGSYGKDVRGIIRQHQFQKVELVKFTRPETSYDELEKLTNNAETVLQKLGLHYRVMALCTGDMSPSSAKTYDLEVWLPGQQLFREISSCSNFEAFQARRANIRWRPEGGKKSEFVHTLNGSGLAIGRTWLAILENYQQADGSVLIPAALQPYMGVERITARKF